MLNFVQILVHVFLIDMLLVAEWSKNSLSFRFPRSYSAPPSFEGVGYHHHYNKLLFHLLYLKCSLSWNPLVCVILFQNLEKWRC